MSKKLIWVLAAMSAQLAWAQGIEGKWRTIDDKTKQPKAVIEITQSGGVYSGRIVALAEGVDPNCGDCSGAQKGKPLVGQTVLRNLKAEGDGFSGGKLTDPKTGKTYSAKAELTQGGKALKVRGYLGVSVAGRTQVWQRVD
ncbi:uncharacterized protein (DUF2147 family) [Neisseria sp. HSC-16F19]|nr:DUF2147 domain-containing protein [Neisseria sp. HSC-16F19]MCP2040563.1 uncharacterized protein (DUF2147 family) [Neisseria sp. HSC-16F19]